MKKNLLSLALCILPCLALQAGSLHNLHNLREQADKFFKQNNVTRSATNDTCTCVMGDEVVALFVEPSSSRFVIMADDNANGMVLGYGDHATDSTSVPPALRNMLRQYRQLLTLTPTVTTPSSRRLLPQPSYPPVEPMLKTKWEQDFPYNMCCPTYDGSEARCATGCVATAIAQVMNYYRYPAVLQDTLYGWNTEHYSLENVNPGTPIMWDDIQNVYDDHSTFEQQDAVAKLNLYCGMMSKMMYTLYGSAALDYSAVNDLMRVMGYDYVRYCSAFSYTPSNWVRLLQQELQSHRPIVLGGEDFLRQGHTFVVDGYNEDGLYHVNWGWAGRWDGYFNVFVPIFYLSSMDVPYEDYLWGFMAWQDVLLLHPDSVTNGAECLEKIEENEIIKSVKILSCEWDREPDTNGYIPLTFQLNNEHTDTLICNIEVFCWPLVYDSLTHEIVTPSYSEIRILEKVHGTLCVILPPHQTTEASTYVHFPDSGEYDMGIFICDTLFKKDLVNIKETVPVKLDYSVPKIIEQTDTSITYVVEITNPSEEGWAGDYLVYYLCDENKEDYMRHIHFMNIPPQTTYSDTVYFNGLTPNMNYVSYLNESGLKWIDDVVLFIPSLTGVKGVMKDVDPSAPCILYNAQGVLLRRFERMEMAEQFLNTQCASGVYLLKSGQKVHKVKVK